MSQISGIKWLSPKYLLIGIIVLAFVVRLYQIHTPLADWHSHRQADTASVAREYVKSGIKLLYPRYHDLSNIQSRQDNPEGYRMVEFPIINGLVATTYPIASFIIGTQIHIWYRFVSILFSLGSLLILYAITKHLYSTNSALITVLVFALLPYNIYYSRSIFPEISMVFFYLLALFAGLKTDQKPKSHWYLVMILSSALALLIKPIAAFFLIPLMVPAINSIKNNKPHHRIWALSVFAMATPLILWRFWISQFPEGIPSSVWLLNSNGIRFRPAWFRWLFYERLAKLILGYTGLALMGLGFGLLFNRSFFQSNSSASSISARFISRLSTIPYSSWFVLAWGLGSLLYLIVFATGNVQHDYYQIPIIPLISLLVGLGLDYLISKPSLLPKIAGIVILTAMLVLSWHQVKGYYQINNWAIVEAGQAVDRIAPRDAKVIAPYLGDTAFLYQTNRSGWPLGHEIDEKIRMGADYYVSTTMDDEANMLKERYQVVAETPLYILIKLPDNKK